MIKLDVQDLDHACSSAFLHPKALRRPSRLCVERPVSLLVPLQLPQKQATKQRNSSIGSISEPIWA